MRPRLTNRLERGTPFEAYGRIFIPEARVTTLVTREIGMNARGTRALGFHARRIQPTALIEQTPRGERSHRIETATARTWFSFAVAALAPLALGALVKRLAAKRK